MVVRFTPLALHAQLNDLPRNYAKRIVLFYGEGNFTTQQHLDKFGDFIDLEEVDDEDVNMILFAQSLSGEVKNGLKISGLGAYIILKNLRQIS